MTDDIVKIVKKYRIYDEIEAEWKMKKSTPYKVSVESEIYRRHINLKIQEIRKNCEGEKQIKELEECLKRITEREKELRDPDID